MKCEPCYWDFNLQLDLRTQLVFGSSDTFGDEFRKKE